MVVVMVVSGGGGWLTEEELNPPFSAKYGVQGNCRRIGHKTGLAEAVLAPSYRCDWSRVQTFSDPAEN